MASPQATELAAALSRAGIAVQSPERGVLTTSTAPAARIGEIAAASGIVLHELTTIHASLEQAYLELTSGEVEYSTGAPSGHAAHSGHAARPGHAAPGGDTPTGQARRGRPAGTTPTTH